MLYGLTFFSAMETGEVNVSDDELEEYAKEQIGASAYPDDKHVCSFFKCEQCGATVPLALDISYSQACDNARPALDFAGTVRSTCSKCGSVETIFSIIRGQHPEEEQEHPVCSCGSDTFLVCMCERYEGAQGLQGFFDEGVIVGKCSACGNLRTFLFTD